ncbi:hypothetical protein NHL51_04315 [Leucobacter sp. gxy201]|uniref:hypothetical protein n=1 Tax=Leucobacter sp. gxy201 TaxID=2957200 RepID=UPI003DA0EA98
MSARKKPSGVRFVPVPPATPNDWRRRVEDADGREPFKRRSDVLNFVIWATTADKTDSTYPASVETYRRARRGFELSYLVPLRHDDIRAVIGELAARNLLAPWWIVTDAQAAYRRKGR